MDNMQYISTLRAQTGLVLSKEQEIELGSFSDKLTINKKFFEILEQNKPAPIEFGQDLTQLLNIAPDVTALPRFKDLTNYIRTYTDKAVYYMNEAENQLRHVSQCRNELNIMLAKPVLNFSDSLKEVLAGGFFKLIHDDTVEALKNKDSSERKLVLATPDIVLTHKNEAAGIDLVVPMGRYRVELYLYNGIVRVKNHYNTRKVGDSYIHPHVSAEGKVCWGNGKGAYNEAVSKQDYAKILQLLQVILTTYSDEMPYKGLESWDRLRHPEKYKNVYTRHSVAWRYEVNEMVNDTESYDTDALLDLIRSINENDIAGFFDDDDNEITKEQFFAAAYDVEDNVFENYSIKLFVHKDLEGNTYILSGGEYKDTNVFWGGV